MREAWELLIAGSEDADRSVLLLPGGANAARSFDLVMADPALSGVRLVATTMPGMAGAPLTDDVSVPGLARAAGEIATAHRCDVVVGFSHGATVATIRYPSRGTVAMYVGCLGSSPSARLSDATL